MENIPVLTVAERSLAETYEQALIRLYKEGTRFRTQYDKPGDPLSLDCTMNMFGFIQFNRKIIAAEIEKRSGKKTRLGRMNWQADSYHIYGKDIETARSMLFDRLEEMPFENRIFNFHDEFIQEMYQGAEAMVLKKIEEYDKSH